MKPEITNTTGLPEAVFESLVHDDYTRGNSDWSVTQLIDAPQIRLLRRKHGYTQDASEMAWMVLGKAVHLWFETHTRPDGTAVAEKRLHADVNGWNISGAIDIQDFLDEGVLLTDYKCTSVWSVIYGKIEWERQLNCYAWLVEQNNNEVVSKLQICAILRDWNRRDKNKVDYPSAPIVVVDVRLWSAEAREEYIRERVAAHQDAEFAFLSSDELPECSDEERWLKPSKYAVKKKGNKRALKLYDNEDDAQAHAEQDKMLIVEHRRGAPTRCIEDYCNVSAHCPQYKKWLEENNEDVGGVS